MDVEELVSKLEAANYAYRKTPNPIISDATFDSLEEQLRELDPNNPYFKKVGFSDLRAEFHHSTPMLSQAKALTKDALLKKLNSLYKQGYTDISASLKLDGLSISLHYEKGRLQRAVTRGDGLVGRDVTKKLTGVVPLVLNQPYNGEIRGELIISFKNFDTLNTRVEDPFSHPRNAVVGLINSDDLDSVNLNLMEFHPFSIIGNNLAEMHEPWKPYDFDSISDIYRFCDNLGFQSVESTVFCIDSLNDTSYESAIENLTISRDEYPADGIVFRLDNEIEFQTLGFTEHHPIAAIAYKFPAIEAVTTIEEIEWSVGTKDITPIAILSPVFVDGAKISRVSLKSVKNMIDKGFNKGVKIVIERSGGVIPKAVKVFEH